MRPTLDRLTSRLSHRHVAAGLAVLAGALIYGIAHGVFPYHTSNHDEAVYLQQAAMLLEGQLTLRPPVPDAFRPWFFVADGGAFYSKYTPVPAAMFAVGGLLGEYRIALALIAAASVALCYAVVAEAFDRTTGVVAAALLLASPLFLVDAAVFLPYVPTFCLNLLFAWAYLRADRTGDRRFAALAGIAVGLAFFARPFTAVLFATPFLVHALWTLRELDRSAVVRQGITALLGLVGVAAALGYNAAMTGDPLVFPYEAFAPRDGLGFGRREILGHELIYDVPLALEANARVLWQFLTRWTVAAPLGSLVAAAGLTVVLYRSRTAPDPRRLIVAGLVVTVPVGNVYFWGNFNILGVLANPADGLIAFLGPYYHVDLLLPATAFAAVAVVAAGRRVRSLAGRPDLRSRAVLIAAVLVAGGLAGSLTVGAAAGPLSENYDVTENYEEAYEPFEERTLDDALVFLPTPYGDWLNHPFQPLRNDPGYDDGTIYALQERQFAVLDAFPNRTLYRYGYRGQWLPHSGQPVTPRLQRVDVASGEEVTLSLGLGVPRFAEAVEVRTSSGDAGASTPARLSTERIDVELTLRDGTVTSSSPAFRDNLTLALSDGSPIRTVVYVDYGSLGGFEYVATLPVERHGDGYRALSPRLEVCRSPRLCGGEATYVPGTHRDGIRMNATLQP